MRYRRGFTAVYTWAAIVLAVLLFAAPASAADRAYAKRFGVNDTGDVRIVGNTSMSCVTSANCTAARAGTGTSANWNNDAWNMAYVNVDSDATTFSSSRATLDLPAGATVLFAGLYWGGDAPAAAARDQVKFDTPAPGGYQDLVATTFDTSTTTPAAYQGFRDVTGLVAAVGAGDYWVANVQGNAGATNKHAGWALVVAYRDAGSPRQNLAIYDGFQDVKTADPHSATLTGLTTPASGTVDATVGVFAHEGDLGITGDAFALNATTLSNGLNPANNAFNSSITRRGVRLSAKNPDYVNQFSVEMDTFAADAIVAPNASSATVNMTSTQDRYYPGVITYAGEAETVPPVTTINSGPSGFTNDPTPTYAFSSNEAGSTFECRVDAGAWTSCTSPNTTASLADGSHTFEVRAIDVAGNVDATPASRAFTVDTIAPQTTIDSGPSGPTNDATPTFAFSADQAGSTFECRVDAGAWGSCSTPETTGSLADGAHTFEVRATDPAGNVDASQASRSFTVDTAAPQTTIDSGPSGPTNDATPTFGFSSSQAGSSFECRVDAGAWGSCSTPETTASLADGAHTFEVRATDPAGNVDPTPASRSFTVDTAAPQTTIDSGPSGPTSDATPTFAFSADQAGSTFECRIDAGAWGSCSSPETTASLADGVHTFEVRATDPAGNVDATPASRNFTVDTAAPDTTIDSGPSGPTNDPTPTFSFSADQAGSTFECRVDAGAWASCGSAHTTASLADGAHSFEVRATDPAGNVDATPASRGFTVDTAAPQTTIDSGPSGLTNDATPTFAFSADQAGSSFECRVDGGAWASCSSAHTTVSLVDGAYSFEARAIDPAGNVDATPASRAFTVDTAAPQTTIDSGPSGVMNDATPTFTFSASQAGSTFECRVDAGAWGSCSTPETTASLTDGAHTFEVRATDPAGNVDPTPASRSFTVDTAAPQTTIDSGPSGLTNDETPTFTFSASEAGSTFECRVDGGAWGSCSTPETSASLTDGAHTFEVRATDLAGNVDPTPASRSFTVDTTAAQTTIDSGPSDPTNDATPTFAFSADQAGSTFECRVDGGAWASCGSPHTTSSLGDGPHTFEVRATDPVGNLDASPASLSFTVDTAAPQTSIDSGPSGLTSDATPTFGFSASQAGSSYECRIDGGAWGSCSTPETTASLPDGAHTFEVRATDPAGNVDPTPASRSFTVDTAAPQTTINSGPSGFTNDPTPTFAFSADEAGSSFECRVDGGVWGLCSTLETTASLADGAHTFEVRATDSVGNVDPTPASRAFTVDTAAPQTTIDSGPSGLTNDATPTFGFSASQAGSSFECRVDAGAWASCSSAQTTASLPDGAHTFEARATDPAGNVDPTPASRGFTVDTAAPQTTIDSGPSGPTNDATPTFTFSADQAGSTFECRVDAGAWGACSTPETTGSLADGAHTFEVRATDPAGNVDATPASRGFTVDTAAPQTTIDSGPSGPTSDATPTFAFSSSQPGSSFECRVDAGAWGSCSTPNTTASLADGSHTFEVRATDPAGNVDATPASWAFTVDTAAPQTTIDSGPSGLTNDATPTFTFSADQAGSTFECRVDGGAWGSCSTPNTTASLADGSHTFEVRATDPAGNVDATPASRSFTVDTAAPNTTIDSGPSGPTNDTTPTFTFSASQASSTFECRVDGGAWGSCSTPETTASLADGAHTFEVRATDPAGNVDATPALRAFTVDTAAPDTTVDSGPSGPTNDATPTFTFSSSQPGSTFECRTDGGAWASCTSAHTTASLGDGPHTFQVRAIDPAGNSDASPAQRAFAVESSPPDTTIDSGPSGATNDPTPTFGFSSDELGTTFECRVDGGPWGGCSAPETTAALADGIHTFEVRATDFVGNVDPTPASRAFSVDTAAPQTTIDSGPSGLTSDATPTFAFSSSQAGSSFECRVDGGAWASCSSPETTASLADGAHTFEVRATDPAGNVDPTPASRGFTVDTAAPQTTIDGGPSGPTNDATPTFAFSADQAGSSFDCRIDGGAWGSCSSPETTGSLADGAHTFEVRATDAAGNVDPTPASRSFTVDTADPQTTIDAGPSGPTNDATPTFSFSSSQAGSSFDCRVDGGAWSPCSSPETVASLADGPHTFEVRATDAAGNVDPTPASRSFTVDTADPQTTIDSGPSGPTNDSTPTFTFSADQAGSTFECSVDGAPWAPCSSPITTASLADGAHTFEVRATDPAGNVDATPASRGFTVDTADPQTTIDSGPSGATSDATPTFAFSADQGGSSFDCRIDGGAWGSCSTPHTTASLADGAHTFEVRAADPAGNVDATPASRGFTVDTADPQTTIDGGPSGPTTDPTPTFAFSADQAGSSFDCRVDGGAWSSCSSPETVTSLADGAHTFEVRATDPAGNVDATPASRSFTVDTAAPQTTIDSGPSGPTTDATPTFAFSADQAGSSFDCRVDGGAWSSCSSPETTGSLADGSHTFEVRATDPAGNVDATPASRGLTVDTAAPQTTIDSGPSGPTNDATPTFAFSSSQAGSSFECSIDGGAWGPCSSPETTAPLADGAHTFEVRATDPAGNVDATPASRSFTVDTGAPDTTIDSGPSGSTNDATPTFAFSSSQAGSSFECSIDGGAWGSCSSPVTTASLADGSHTFEVRATDPAGNVDPTPASRSFTVDTALPQTTIDAGPSGPTNDPTPTFTVSSSQPGSSFDCRVDGGAWSSCSSPETVASLGDGAHTFEVRATDPAGNVDATPASRSFTVDTGAPDTTIDSGPSGPTNDPTPTFGISADQAGSSFDCRVDGGAWSSCSSPETTASLADGAHTFEVRATDPAGNVDATPASRSFTVDTATPDTTIDSGPSGPTNDATPTFTFSADQAGSTFECRVDGGAWASCSSPHTTVSLSDGAHTFEVRTTDPAGNVDATPDQSAFVVESGPPDTTIDSGPSGATNDPTPTFGFSANELGATFECRVDGGAWASCSSVHTTASLADGAHTFDVRATDPAGNVDPTPASRSVTVDTATPQATIDSGPSGPTNDATPTFTFSADQPGATFECRIDGGAWASCSSAHTTPSLADGEHTFEVRATDPAGNVDPSPALRTFTVDTAVPNGNPTGTPSDPPSPVGPSGTEPAPTSDLSALPGSLVGERSCQRLGAGLRTKRLKVRGIGRVTVRIRASAIVMADDPLTVGVTGPRAGKGRLRSVGYTLDGRRMRGSRRQPFPLAITPAALVRVGRHALTLKLKPRRGRPGTVKLGMRTFPCKSVFRAYQKRTRAGSQLKLRVDARDAITGATFNVPSKMLPKHKARLKVGTLRVVSASGGSRSWSLAFGATRTSQMLVSGVGAPSVTVRGSQVTVGGLPAGSGIVEILLNTKQSALVSPRRSVGLRATVTGAPPQRLSYKLRGRR